MSLTTMFDIDLTRERGRARLSLAGTLDSHDDCDLLTEAFSFVQPTDDLMLDLTDVDVLDREAAVWLHSSIQCRSSTAETVIVSPDIGVSKALVLCNVDRVTPIVRDRIHSAPPTTGMEHAVGRRAAIRFRPGMSNVLSRRRSLHRRRG